MEFDFGKIRTLRRKNHLKQAELGERLCCSGPCVSKAELGMSAVTADNLARMADIFGIHDMNVFFVNRIGGKEND